MKKILHILFVGILLFGAVVSAHAANGIIETKYYQICAGDTITPDAHQTRISSDTIVYDTINVMDPNEDSIYVYVVNVYPVFFKTESRTIETGTSFTWRDLLIDHAGTYDRVYKTIHDCDSTYQLVVTEKAGKPEKPVTFTICDGESVEFNGQVYSASGTYYNDMNADTVYKITIVKHPSQLYQQTAVIDATHPYYWQYMLDGELHTDTLTEPGVYEYTTQNPETGCNDTHRLIVTRDETSYHFEEAWTICENEEFSWHGLSGLNHQGIGTTTDYFDRYVSQAGKDSIYHLALTVHPVPRRTQTLTFCESISWNGKTYTESGLVIDTLTSVLGCDSIITTVLVRGIPFHRHDTATIVPGETLVWHGMTINNKGLYEDKHITSMGCDSVYTLGVGLKEAAPQMDMRTDYVSICYGDEYVWRGKTYREPNRYVDTLYTDNTQTEVDSLFVLVLSVNPRYDLTERVTFRDFPVNYRNTLISGPGIYPIHYTASTGCDSTITLMVDREVIRDEQTVTICPGETYLWRGHEYQESHRYVETETDANGVDSVEHILNLTVKYIPETRITRTICRGTSYTFADQTLTESGIYTHTFHDTGCDSVVVLSLNVLNADTVKYIRHINEGESYPWHNKIYHETGVDYYTTQNRFGCDSTEMLILTVNHVDTIDSVATICPGETLEWHGIRASQNGVFTNAEQQPSGDFIYYRLHLTVRELQQVEVDFTVCGNENVVYNGKTYTEAGYYYDMLGCDTIVRIHVKKNPLQVYETHGTLGGEHGFTWTYMDNGTEHTEVFDQAGTYEYESPNSETGCSDLWRLVLTKDESSYHFVETLTICEGDNFTWHGLTNLSRQIGNDIHYFDTYQTRTGNDSIYELILTVLPAKRTVSSVTFCGETTWKGHTYTQSAVVYDTLVSATGCDSIVRINLDKASSFYKHDTATIVQGEILHWHGLQISTDGLYRDAHVTQFGCDSIYEIGVGLIAATPQTNLYTTQFSICDGDVYTWRGKDYKVGGTYVDTVWTEGREKIDSIFVLRLTVLQSYSDTIVRHMYSCSQEAGIRYNGRDYFQSQAVIENLRTVGGCDSIVKIFMHVGESLYQRDTVRIGDTKVPYAWRPNNDTTIYLSTPGTHTYSKPAEGGCDNVWELYLEIYSSFLREDSIAICESELPFYWQNGPEEKRNEAISGQPGQTLLVEYNYPGTIIGVDSIYRLKLYIMPQIKHVEQITLCEGQQKTLPNGKTYYMLESDSVYRDTVYFANPNMPGCDSIVYYEIQQFASLTQTETKILHVGETIHWHGQTITSGGPYEDIVPAAAAGGCDSIYHLNVVQEMREEMVVCKIDTPDLYPVIWRDDTLYTTGLWTDTVYENGFIKEYYSLDLTITLPYDTTIYLKGCDVAGVTWRDETFMQDTAFIDRIPVTPYNPKNPCDSVFHVNIKVGKTYNITITDTICESDLPYILGRQNPDTIWTDARHRPQPHTDTTACGCDSTVNLVLYITPTLAKNDSTFACEDEIAEHPVVLGDTINPWFQYREGGKYADIWRGKWTGIEYTHDTIVWDCNHEYFHHIIVRPRQSQPKDTTYYLCEGDSVQLFWPKDTMIKTPGIYYDTVVNVSPWRDTEHSQYIHNDKAYACDSVIRWTVLYADALTVDTTERHIALGDSIFWGGEYRYFTGYYDSICDSQQGLQDSEQRFCKEHHWLHLTADTVYRYTDTIHICHPAYLEYTHTFADQHEVKFNTPDQDTAIIHVADSTKQIQYNFYDHYYTLVAYYHQQYLTQIEDTICEGGEYRWDIHRNNTTIERWLNKEGTYRDTLEAMNGCDSIIELHLRVRYRNEVTHKTDMITDRELPYLWPHTWHNGQGDTTVVDTLHYSGEYRFVMPSIHGCDSVDSLHLTIHETHVFYDTIQVCSPINITHTHVWATGYEQKFTVPQDDQQIHYYDTLRTEIPLDSIYDLYVDFHQQYLTQIEDTICEGGEYRWDIHRNNTTIERWLSEEGTYRDTLEAMNGCDSIIELHLRVRYRNEVTHKTVMITDRELPYLWPHTWHNGQGDTTVVDTLYYSGEYRFVMPSIHGCDSVDSLHLTIHETHVFYDTIQVCSPINITHTHVWATGYEQKFTVPQDDQQIHYYDTLRTFIPLDSIYDLYVDYHVQTITYLDTTLCEGDSLRFGLTKSHTPRFLSKTGIYRDTLTRTANGCDSIIELRLNVFPRYNNYQTVHIADTDTPYIWPHYQGGHMITADTLYATGEYVYRFQSEYSCDSIDSLSLRVHTTYLFRDTVQICQSETPYIWYDKQDIYETGEYIKHFQTHDGYDSTYVRYVKVMPVTYDTIETTICEGDSIRFGLSKQNKPRFLYDAGTYTDTLVNSFNCDSIVTLRLNIYPKHYEHHQVDIADTDTPYVWPHYQGGHLIASDTLHAAGEYAYHFQSSHGCDSIDSLSLRVHITYLFRDTVTICSDQTPYTWYDKQDIYETGEYRTYFQTHDGYDSTYVRYVQVLPVIHDTVRHAMCEGTDYLFNGKRYTEAGTYTDTLVSMHGCDSIVTLVLTVNKSVYVRIPADIYEGEHYTFYGVDYTTSGTYRHYGQTAEGCDSIAELFLTVHPQIDTTVIICKNELPYTMTNRWSGETKTLYQGGIYRDDTTYVDGQRTFFTLQLIVNEPQFDTVRAAICEGSSYAFRGIALTESGIYRDTVRAANGCDSITTLILTVNQPYYNHRVEHIFEGQQIQFFDTICKTTGTYYHYGTTPEGCDSTTVLQLIVHQLVDTTVTVCSDDLPYMWVNKWNGTTTPLYTAGIYRNDTTYLNGERMFYGLQLVVNQPQFDTIRHSMCRGSSYDFRGNTYYEQGIYRDTLAAANGCDSIVTLILTVNEPYYNVIRETILEGHTYDFFGDTYSTSGTYTHYARTPEGCDSTTVLQLSVHPLVDTVITVCDIDIPVIWHNRWSGNVEQFYSEGLYRNDTIINGEKRFYGIQVNIHTQVFDTIRHAMCQGSSFDFKGNTYYEQGIYRDTLAAANGCDSIVTLILTVNEPYYNVIRETILEGHTYDFFGDTYSTSGTYTHYARTPEGCDSTTVLQLSVHPLVDTVITVCDIDIPVIWHNRWSGNVEQFYSEGLYRNDTIINGEKRFYGIQININTQVFDTIRHAMCQGSSFDFKGNTYYEQGIYRDTLAASNGCDSIVTLILTVNEPYYNVIRETILEGHTYDFFGDTYSTSGTYTHYARTPEGCDSTTVLQLSVHPLVDTVITVCDIDIPVIWHNRWSGNVEQFYSEGLYRNDTIINGEKRFYGIQVNIHTQVFDTIRHAMCQGSSFDFKGNTYYEQGIYRDTLAAANGCDSIVTLILTVNEPYYNVIRETILEGHTYDFFGDTYSTSGTYTHYARTPEGCDSTTVLQLSVHPLVDTVITVCDIDIPVIWHNRWSGNVEQFYSEGLYRNDTIINGEKRFYGIQVNIHTQVFDTIRHAMCQGSSFDFKGNTYYEQGIYRDTLAAANGCDSIVTLILTVNEPYYNVIRETILEGHTYDFFGDTYSTSGTYTHYARTPEGCDSTTVLQLSVHPLVDTVITVCDIDIPVIWHNRWSGNVEQFYSEGLYRNDTIINGEKRFYGIQVNIHTQVFDTIRHAMCQGSSFDFKGNTYYEQGIYRDTLAAANGCDSIVTLILTVNEPYYNVIRETILEGHTYDFFGDTYSTSGTYTHYARTPEGCDSTTVLQLSVHPLVDTVITVCDIDIPVIWHNRWSGNVEQFYSEGLYRNDTIINGEKRFYGIQVNIHTQVFDTIRHAMCQGSSFDFKGNTYYEQGIYRDTLAAANGCDSIVTLILTVNEPYYKIIRETILEGQYYVFFGDTIRETMTVSHSGRTPEGCDSTTVLELTVHQLVDTVVTICASDLPYEWTNKWNGLTETFWHEGTYRNDTSINGERFFYGIQLKINEQTFDTIRAEMCYGSTYLFGKRSITEAGIYRDTLLAQNGCDSIVSLILTVHEPYYNARTEHIIEGNSIVFYGDTFNTTGVYTHYGKTEYGCDSTTVLHLYVHPLVDTVVTVCSSDLPYEWVNKWDQSVTLLTTEGIYRNDNVYFNGERMFCGLQLIVTQPTDSVIYREICEDDVYNFNGKFISQAGEYRDTIKNVQGCDSIVILHLNVLKKYYNTIDRTIPEGDTVHFYGNVYNKAGSYPIRFTSSFGCDSIVELHLNVIRLFDDSVSVCANALPYLWTLPSDSTKYLAIYESGVYRDTVINNEGKETSIGIRVTVLPVKHAEETIVATICEGDTYKFGDDILSVQGTYYDTLVASNGCDSIVMLTLQVIPIRNQQFTRTIYEGDTVMFHDQILTTAGIYTYKETNANGCTDTEKMVLTVLKEFHVDTTAYWCSSNLPFRWHGYEFNESGDFTIPTAWTDSSRVITTLHLTIRESYYTEENISVCYGNAYIINGKDITNEKEHYDTIPSQNGCDSIVKYIISVYPRYEKWDTIHISDKQSYPFDGRTLTIPGDYESTSLTRNGCDSIVHLHLEVHPSYYYKDSADVCQPGEYVWINHGKKVIPLTTPYVETSTGRLIEYEDQDLIITETGTYYDNHLTQFGFDSIYEIRVEVHPSYMFYEQYEIGENEQIDFHGQLITAPGVYYDHLYSQFGCDSIYTMVVNPKRVREYTWTKSICQGDYIDLPDGRRVTATGNYTYYSVTRDTIIHLSLTVIPTSYSEERIVISEQSLMSYPCDSGTCNSYVYKGHLYEDLHLGNNIFEERTATGTKCDNIKRLIIFVTRADLCSDWDQIPLCPGHQIKIDGEVITEAGYYTFVRRSKVTGEMDSLYRVEVFDAPDFDFPTIQRTICDGDTVFIGGKAITRAGHHDILLQTVHGCDSIYHLDLTVNPSYHFITDSTIIDYESVTWRGKTYNQTGTYDRSWPTIHDCDSTYSLRLTVIPTQRDTLTKTICADDSYFWRGKTYNTDGFYSDTVRSIQTNFSAIYSLRLIVAYPTTITKANISEACADDLTFDIDFEYDGAKPEYYNVYFDALAKREGFRDVINARFGSDMIAHIDMPQFSTVAYESDSESHAQYVRPDYYTMRLVLDNGICGISQSADLTLLVKYPSWIIQQNWDDVVAPLRPELNGGYTFVQYEWWVNGEHVPMHGQGYLHKDDLKVGDEVVMKVFRDGENYNIPTCPLIIKSATPMTPYPTLDIYPTQAPRHAPVVTLQSVQDGSYSIYSSTGTLIQTGTFSQGEQQLTLPAVNGIWFIRTQTTSGQTDTHKIMIY